MVCGNPKKDIQITGGKTAQVVILKSTAKLTKDLAIKAIGNRSSVFVVKKVSPAKK